jgi:ferredoxin
LIFVLSVLSSILLAAHFSRIQNDKLALFCLAFTAILLIKKPWIRWIFQIYLTLGGFVWLERALFLRAMRLEEGRAWIRLVIILGGVALLTFYSAWLLRKPKVRTLYAAKSPEAEQASLPAFLAFCLTGLLLAMAHIQVSPPILLVERFLPGTGVIEITLLALYAAWITEKMLLTKNTSQLRSRIWLLFSVVFFAQFILGIAGIEKCMMTGKLHLPIPALIAAGPIFRGSGFFMPILFVSTVLLAGAAWCSHLCYIGSWDNLCARSQKCPKPLPRWWHPTRIAILFTILLFAWIMRFVGIDGTTAGGIAIIYGLAGLGIMLVFSRHNGVMSHCTVYCPIGMLADFIGRINPFRIRIKAACDGCGACTPVCRYNALNAPDIERRKPGISCTLCGDCLPSCNKTALSYSFLGLKPGTARKAFIVIIITLHALFLGVARI